VRIAIVYDCLYPYTVGGAERRYHGIAARLATRHQVTYVTRRQWPAGETPDAPPGVRVVAVSGGRSLYTGAGRRNVSAPLRFGGGVLRHLLRHRDAYDVVHTCGFPYFALLAARLANTLGGPPVVTDWLEVWSREYWRDYLGPVGGRVGAAVQRLCVRLTGPAFVLSELAARRLVREGYRGHPTILRGLHDGVTGLAAAATARAPLVVYIGRHIREKGVVAIPAAIAQARQHIPELRAAIFGDGPERPRVIAAAERLGLSDIIDCPGFVSRDAVDAALDRALCLLLPSRREGYGLVVVEAAAHGTPSIVLRHPDSAATELIEPDRNGVIVEGDDAPMLAAAIEAVHAAGPALAERTREWFTGNAATLGIEATIEQLERTYASVASTHPRR